MAPYRPILPNWSSHVGDMLAAVLLHGARVAVSCPPCDRWEVLSPAQLARIVQARNPLYSFVNRRPPCGQCGRGMTFQVANGASGPFRPLLSEWPEDVDPLHAAWIREHRRRRKIGAPDER